MIYKSSQQSRKSWGQFSADLQKFSIVDSQGNVIPKRYIFEMLFNESTCEEQVQLSLVAAGLHEKFSLIERKEFDEAVLRQQIIEEITREELTSRAVKIGRRFNIKDNFDEVVKFMVEGMLHVLENHRQIDDEVKARLK